MKNIVRRNDVVDTQQLEESFKISRNYKKYGTSDIVKKTNCTEVTKTVENKRYHIRSENDETLDSIQPVTGNSKKANRNPIKQQQTERCVKITNNQREFSFERKRSSPKNKRKIPSSAEETNKKKQKMVVTVKGLHWQTQHIRHLKKPAKIIEKKDQGNGNTAKRSGRNTTNSSSKKKAEEEARTLYNEGYYTDNINSDS